MEIIENSHPYFESQVACVFLLFNFLGDLFLGAHVSKMQALQNLNAISVVAADGGCVLP